MKSRYDVVIVGGGPAGLSAALSAAQFGVDVLLVERNPRIGEPLCCAEGITVEGLTRIVEPRDEWISSGISGAKLFSPDGYCAYIDHPDAGFVIDRTVFEPYLAETAQYAGAEIVTGCRADNPIRENGKFVRIDIVSHGTKRSVEFKVLIAADGVESTIARHAGLLKNLVPSRLASCAEYRLEEIPIDPEIPEFYLDHSIAPGGYAWIFPKGADSANVGLGIIPTMAEDTAPFEFLDGFVKRRFASYRITKRMMGVVPVFEGRRTMLKSNMMAVGDAARLLDSLTGAGIATALYSGQLAGELAGEYVRGGQRNDCLKEYPKRFMKVFGRKLRAYVLAHQVLIRLKPDELDFVVRLCDEFFGGRKIYALEPIDIIKQIFIRKPALLKYARHLVWR